MDLAIIRLMTEIYKIFIDLSYLNTTDVIFPDLSSSTQGREFPHKIAQLLAELSLLPQAISLLRRLPYISPGREDVYEVEIYPTETQPMDWLDGDKIRYIRVLGRDEVDDTDRGVLGHNEITLAVPLEGMGRYIILDLEEGTIRTFNCFDSPEYVFQHRDELANLPFPDNNNHYRNIPPTPAIEFLES